MLDSWLDELLAPPAQAQQQQQQQHGTRLCNDIRVVPEPWPVHLCDTSLTTRHRRRTHLFAAFVGVMQESTMTCSRCRLAAAGSRPMRRRRLQPQARPHPPSRRLGTALSRMLHKLRAP